MKQTDVTSYILPDGLNLAIQPGGAGTFHDIGLLAGGVQLTHNFDKEVINGGNKDKIIEKITNQTVAIAPSALWSHNLTNMQKLFEGVFNLETTAGSIVSGAEQVVSSGGWAYNKFIKIENQNGDGSEITVNSVTGGTDGLLTDETDYYVGQNDSGEWGVIVVDSVNVTTLSQSITIDYDYTPNASKKITAGDSTTTLSDFTLRMRHYTDSALTTYDMEVLIYSTTSDAGFNVNFKGQNEDGLLESTVSFTGAIDSDRSAGDQLFSWLISDSALES